MHSQARSRTRRTHHDNVRCEPLEPRALLAAHAIADYFPLDASTTWNYSGTLNGSPMTAIASLSAGPSLSGIPSTRITTVFQPNAGGSPTTDTRYFAHTVTGLRLLGEDIVEPSMTSGSAFGVGARWVTPSFEDGAVIHIVKTFSGSANGRAFTGRFVGDMTINGVEVIDTSAGSFEAIKISLVGAFTENGSTGWTADGTIAETRWMARGVGSVRVDYAEATNYSDLSPTSLRYNMGLTAASRLGDMTGTLVTGKTVVVAFGDTSPGAADGTNFAGVDINGATKTRLFKITNTSGSSITLRPGSQGFITISGANAGEFTVIRQPSQTILPGQTALFSVRLDPAAEGFRFATVSFATDNNSSHPFTFDIRGTGIFIGAIHVTGGAGTSILNGSTAAQTADGTRFGPVSASGSASVVRTFIISNSGVGPLVLSGMPRVSINGLGAQNFVVTAFPAGSVAPGGTTSFSISFDPGALGATGATISILSNDRFNYVFTFAIAGTGI